MTNPESITTDAEILAAINRAQHEPYEPRAAKAQVYPAPLNLLVIDFETGQRLAIPIEDLQGLAGLPPVETDNIEILSYGLALRWPTLNVDHWIPDLREGFYGNKRWMEQLSRRNTTDPHTQPSPHAKSATDDTSSLQLVS